GAVSKLRKRFRRRGPAYGLRPVCCASIWYIGLPATAPAATAEGDATAAGDAAGLAAGGAAGCGEAGGAAARGGRGNRGGGGLGCGSGGRGRRAGDGDRRWIALASR